MHANSEIENACLNESAAFRPQCGIIATVFVILYNVDRTILICHNKINLFVNIIIYNIYIAVSYTHLTLPTKRIV